MNEDEMVHQAIWDNIPELREELVAYERKRIQNDLESGLEPYIGAYALITDVFVWPHFLPLVDESTSDELALQRCANAVEQILEAHTDYLDSAVSIRIISHLLREPERWRRFREYAGPLLRDFVLNDSQYYVWPFDEPVV